MAGVALANPRIQFLDSSGNPLSGGFVHVYLAGTTTETDSWQDRAQTTLNTNPIVLDSAGACQIVLSSALTYKIVVTDSAGVTQSHLGADNVIGAAGASFLAEAVAAIEAQETTSVAAVAAQQTTSVNAVQSAQTTAEDAVDALVTEAETAKTATETARDAALAATKIYASTAAGLAAVASGEYFYVPSSASSESLILYLDNAGVAVEQKRFAAAGIVGEVVKGAIYPVDNGNANQVVIQVAAGTVVEGRVGTKQLSITLTAGANLTIDRSTTHVGIDGTSTGRLYCTSSGALGVVWGTQSLPAGENVVIAFCYATGTATGGGGAGAYFPYQPIVPTNNYFFSRANGLFVHPHLTRRTINMKDLGAAGDGAADNATAFTLLYYLAAAWRASPTGAPFWKNTKTPYVAYFPSGTYLTTSIPTNMSDVKFLGDGKTVSTIKSYTAATLLTTHNCEAEDICFYNIRITGASVFLSSTPDRSRYVNCKFKWDSGVTSSSTYGVNTGTVDHEVTDCEFEYGTIYIPYYLTGYRKATIERNIFNQANTGYASHAIRFDNPGSSPHSVVVRHNKVWNGTTGIFFASNRVRPIEGVIVEGNRLYQQAEESISFDGFGNNTGLCPVIASGTITAAAQDAGRLKLTVDLLYNPAGVPGVACPLTVRSDWTTFYFTFESGCGEKFEGVWAKIVAYDDVANTLTVDVYGLAADVTIGGECGVHAGFFDCVVRDNYIQGSVGSGYDYATGLSIYLNVFGFKITGNTVIGCANAIQVSGGQMLTTYRSLAWGNVVEGNNFLNCNQVADSATGVIMLYSYSLTVKQYGNIVRSNNVVGGNQILLQYQRNFTYEGNMTPGVGGVAMKYCGNSLPTAGAAWMGRTFTLITDNGSGDPTAIDYYVCKLSGGVYSWVAV